MLLNGLAKGLYRKMYCGCIKAIITRSKTEIRLHAQSKTVISDIVSYLTRVLQSCTTHVLQSRTSVERLCKTCVIQNHPAPQVIAGELCTAVIEKFLKVGKSLTYY